MSLAQNAGMMQSKRNETDHNKNFADSPIVVIGITGTIGSGKSTFSKLLSRECSIPVIDADLLSRQAVEKGSKGLLKIKKYFGSGFITPEGELDRGKMAKCVFEDNEKKLQLESIIHPFVVSEMQRLRDLYKMQGESFVIFECPLLFESELTHLVDYAVVVVADEAVIRERLKKNRSMTDAEITARIQNQMSVDEKKRRSDFIIENNEDEATLVFRARQLYEVLLERRAYKTTSF